MQCDLCHLSVHNFCTELLVTQCSHQALAHSAAWVLGLQMKLYQKDTDPSQPSLLKCNAGHKAEPQQTEVAGRFSLSLPHKFKQQTLYNYPKESTLKSQKLALIIYPNNQHCCHRYCDFLDG